MKTKICDLTHITIFVQLAGPALINLSTDGSLTPTVALVHNNLWIFPLKTYAQESDPVWTLLGHLTKDKHICTYTLFHKQNEGMWMEEKHDP